MGTTKTVAIACQGGGSHCAFGAGALIELLRRITDRSLMARRSECYRIIGLSGTSGGAINALLAWYGLIHPDGPQAGIRALEGFWRDTMASTFWDAMTNVAVVTAVRLQDVLPSIQAAPNALSDQAQAQLKTLIERHVPVSRLGDWLTPSSPELFISAANVRSGAFAAFGGAGRHSAVTVEQVLASAAVPELFHPVRIGGEYYWDGLLSQNPPIRNFLRGRNKDRIPDEIWIIRINPVGYDIVPESLTDIRDRRNEMAGNLALEEEKYFIGQVNEWVEQGRLPDKKHVALHEIALEQKGHAGDGLDYASKLDRTPAFLEALMQRGREAAARFLGPAG